MKEGYIDRLVFSAKISLAASKLFRKTALLLTITFLISSCTESIPFTDAQPVSKKDLTKIPKRLRGIYKAKTESEFLTITDKLLVKWADVELKTVVDSLDIKIDSTKLISQSPDNIHIKEGNYDLRMSYYSEDSVLVNYQYHDTIFAISDQQVLRKFKGHYFLNSKRSEANWQVERLTLLADSLEFSHVRMPEDISNLKEVTEVQEIKTEKGEVINYKLNPTRKELKELMEGSFSRTEIYHRVE